MPTTNSPHPVDAFIARRLKMAALLALMLVACESPEPAAPIQDPESVAKQAVAEFLSVPMADVTLVSLTAREFSDSSLDCPEPGMSYIQVLTPGYQVVVEAEGRRFDVRISAGRGRICRRLKSKAPARDEQTRSPVSALIDLARLDLARLLDTDEANIEVLEVRPFNVKNAPAGCSPDCDSTSRQCGYMIGLLNDGRRYTYHADRGQVEPCPSILEM